MSGNRIEIKGLVLKRANLGEMSHAGECRVLGFVPLGAAYPGGSVSDACAAAGGDGAISSTSPAGP